MIPITRSALALLTSQGWERHLILAPSRNRCASQVPKGLLQFPTDRCQGAEIEIVNARNNGNFEDNIFDPSLLSVRKVVCAKNRLGYNLDRDRNL
ncbi:unnamed protein product [Colias eurytheme]|nr:unnamed protein product [Colias eurytheme]